MALLTVNQSMEDDELELIPGLQDFPLNKEGYMGSVTNGMGLHECQWIFKPAIHH